MPPRNTQAPDAADSLRPHSSANEPIASPQTSYSRRGPTDHRNIGAYHGMASARGPPETIALGDSVPSPPVAARDLGILPRADTSWPGATAVSGAEAGVSPNQSPPLTGGSLGGLLRGSSTMSSAAASPRLGLLSRRPRAPTTALERVKMAFSRRSTPSTETRLEPLGSSAGLEDVQEISGGADVEAEAGPGVEHSEDDEHEELDEAAFRAKFAGAPTYCSSETKLVTPRCGCRFIAQIALCLLSSVMSTGWLVLAAFQPRYGRIISSGGLMLPTTATVFATLISRTIEMLFASVFMSYIGQVLTRQSVDNKSLRGMTLAEMTMRSWVTEPGALISSPGIMFRNAFSTRLGALCLAATVAATLYTPASDAMVSPKLMMGRWESRTLVGMVRSSYGNNLYAMKTCPYLFRGDVDSAAPESCLSVQFSGQSYRNLQGFMRRWIDASVSGRGSGSGSGSGSGHGDDVAKRPVGTHLLYDNTTMTGTWIETEHANVTRKFGQHRRIVNNVTMAMPHPGVYAAATNRANGILQPEDLDYMGEYAMRASVVSPAINVMCVSVSRAELAPLVYTEWPHSRNAETGVGAQTKGLDGWEDDVPRFKRGPAARYFNRTVVDDIFRWGPAYGRWPPAFQFFPADHNLAVNASGFEADALYLLAKKAGMASYTLCEMRSWLSPKCSTHFNISGTAGATMRAHCEDAADVDAYHRKVQARNDSPGLAEKDWRNVAEQWRLSMDLNGGSYNNNASNARILTRLALHEARLDPALPSLAEALAAFGSSTLVVGAVDTPFRHGWALGAPDNILDAPGSPQEFEATVSTKEYQSGHNKAWKKAFYAVLVVVPLINLVCLVYFVRLEGLMTDFTDPLNTFVLAINSPPSARIKGSCGGGPQKPHFEVPWRVRHVEAANHYFFENDHRGPRGEKLQGQVGSTAMDYVQVPGSSARRLRSRQGWL